MLRSRSVFFRRVRNALFGAAALTLLSLASRAAAGQAGSGAAELNSGDSKTILITSSEGSARAAAIAAELRARGFDVLLSESSREAASLGASVDVAADGVVTVLIGETREVLPSSDADSIAARRVAESVRAAFATAKAPEFPVPAPAPALVPKAPESAKAPSPNVSALMRRGVWFLSVDDALPLLAAGGMTPRMPTESASRSLATVSEVTPAAGVTVANVQRLAFGDPLTSSPKPMSLDAVIAPRVTFGFTPLAEYVDHLKVVGGSLRVGYMIPLGERVLLWPRLGVSHESLLRDDSSVEENSWTALTVDARLLYAVTPSWALTVGPKAAFPLASTLSDAQPRLGFAVGLTGMLRESSSTPSVTKASPPPRFFLGVARALPMFRYRVDLAQAGKPKTDGVGQPVVVDAGTVNATSGFSPEAPVFTFDTRVTEHLTVGTGASVGVVRYTSVSGRFLPRADAMSVVSWSVSPRVGWRTSFGDSFALWPRVGLNYVNQASDLPGSTEEEKNYHLGVDADAFAEFSPVPGVGLLFGPSLEVPVFGATTVDAFSVEQNRYSLKRIDFEALSLGFTAGLVVEIP